MRTQRKYERHGLLALDPQAFMGVFFEPPPKPVNTIHGDVEVVAISGPLDQHAGDWCDSYEAILGRIDTAFAGKCSTVVLRLNSPGGLVSGCFDTARAIRSRAQAAGKRLVCHVDGQACSAAYAIAAAADEIVASETSVIGSIGVIDTRVDATAADAAQGLRFAFVSSGTRKADGNPHQGISTAELLEKQGIVDSLAGVFFALVKDMRGVDPAPLEARLFAAADAKAKGLIDGIESFDQLLARLASAATGAVMASAYEEARAALAKAAEGDNEEAKKAKRALAAMDGEDDDKSKDDEAKKAEGESDDDKPKDDEAKKASVAASTASALATALSSQARRLETVEKQLEANARAAIFASRPDLSPALVKALASSPVADVQRIVDATPRVASNLAATAVVPATVGAGQADGKAVGGSGLSKAMDRRMGLTKYDMGVRLEGTAQTFGIVEVANDAKSGGGK
jgi:ClpP class serine protease